LGWVRGRCEEKIKKRIRKITLTQREEERFGRTGPVPYTQGKVREKRACQGGEGPVGRK